MKIGVLAVQGAFIEHIEVVKQLKKKLNINIECVEIRQKKDLLDINGIILPGGESTVQSKLLHKLDLHTNIRELINNGLPVLGTCAGLILLANKINNNGEHKTNHLATIPITVKRNAYGRQLGSFIETSNIGRITNYPHVFIRAPYITEVSNEVKILSIIKNKIVGVEYQNQIGLSFHPEMTKDYRIHEYFIKKIINKS